MRITLDITATEKEADDTAAELVRWLIEDGYEVLNYEVTPHE